MRNRVQKVMSSIFVIVGLLIVLFLSQIAVGQPIYEYDLIQGQVSFRVGVLWNWSVFIGMLGVSMLYLGSTFLLYRPSIVEHLALFVWFLCLNCWRSVTQAAYEMWESKHEISFCTEHGIQPLFMGVHLIAFIYVIFCLYSYFQTREYYLVRNVLAAVLLFFGVMNYWVITYGSRWFFAVGIIFLALMLGLRIGYDFQQSRQAKHYVDTHTHYFLKNIVDKREKLIQESRKRGVEKFVSVAIAQESNQEQGKLFAKDEDFYFAAGLHPSFVKSKADVKWINETLGKYVGERTVAIGETGLDYHDLETTEDEKAFQQECFRAQIKLALDKQLPLILHIRDKENETAALEQSLSILQEYEFNGNAGVVHCFHYGIECESIVKKLIQLGFSFGIGGKLCEREDVSFRRMVRKLPMERIMLETDCPYVKPKGMLGKVNSSLAIPIVAKELAQLKRISLQEVADVTSENAGKLFVWSEKSRRIKKSKKTEKFE